MKVTVLEPEDPAAVRARTGLNTRGSFYATRRKRPAQLRRMAGQPDGGPRPAWKTREAL